MKTAFRLLLAGIAAYAFALNGGAATSNPEEAADYEPYAEPGDLWLEEFLIEENGWTNTSGWIGWVYPSSDGWAYSDSLEGWIYAGGVDDNGGWIWISQ